MDVKVGQVWLIGGERVRIAASVLYSGHPAWAFDGCPGSNVKSGVFLTWVFDDVNYAKLVKDVPDLGTIVGPGLNAMPGSDLSKYPHECPRCHSPAYRGFNSIDCSNKNCGN